MDESNVIRIREARDRLNKSRTDAKSKEADLLKIYNSILTESGVDVRNMIVPGKFKCPSGPIGTCVYNYESVLPAFEVAMYFVPGLRVAGP